MTESGTNRLPLCILRTREALGRVLGLVFLLVVSACGGGGGGSPAPVPDTSVAPVPQAPTSTGISGKATFQMVPHDRFTNRLVYQFTFSKPIRGAVAELVSDSGTVLATTTTSEDGGYSFTTDVNQQVSIRVKAQMQLTGSPSWDVSVVDNVRRDALYTLTSGQFTTAGASMVRDLEAGSGWTGNAYTEVRAAGPFAIMDVVYDSMQKVLEANPVINFP